MEPNALARRVARAFGFWLAVALALGVLLVARPARAADLPLGCADRCFHAIVHPGQPLPQAAMNPLVFKSATEMFSVGEQIERMVGAFEAHGFEMSRAPTMGGLTADVVHAQVGRLRIPDGARVAVKFTDPVARNASWGAGVVRNQRIVLDGLSSFEEMASGNAIEAWHVRAAPNAGIGGAGSRLGAWARDALKDRPVRTFGVMLAAGILADYGVHALVQWATGSEGFATTAGVAAGIVAPAAIQIWLGAETWAAAFGAGSAAEAGAGSFRFGNWVRGSSVAGLATVAALGIHLNLLAYEFSQTVDVLLADPDTPGLSPDDCRDLLDNPLLGAMASGADAWASVTHFFGGR